jgi:Ca2+-binding RTX toxin-like protein
MGSYQHLRKGTKVRRTGLIAAAAIIMLVLGSSVAFAVSMAGTIGADTLNGTAQADKLSGSDGADTISGLGGNDELYSDSGNDKLNGGDGNDKLFDGFGKYLLSGGAGDDFLNALDLQGGGTLNCGTGADRWVADWNDIVQANCKPPQ